MDPDASISTIEPDTSATLESLDDLIKKRRSQTSLSSRAKGVAFGDDHRENRLSSHGQVEDEPTSSSSMTITPSIQSTRGAPRERDESRWNGFRLWRTESYNRQRAQRVDVHVDESSSGGSRWLEAMRDKMNRAFSMGAQIVGSSPNGTDGTQIGAKQAERISTTRLFLLTLIMAGAQLAWCLEFGYGTPYLLSLNISKAGTSLVWLAAPLSGMIMQPLVGVLSDLNTSSFRRRWYIIISVAGLVLSTTSLAFSSPVASTLVDIFHTGLADWDPARQDTVDEVVKFIAIASFVFLDISINSLQAVARSLILDTAPSSQHSRANAWHGRMTHVGNIAGYAAGWYDLSSSPVLSWLGGGQFRKYAVLSMLGVTVCSAITCACIQEQAREESEGSIAIGVYSKIKEALHHIWQSIRRLPRPVRRICIVQLFAFMGWFPLLFYSSQWIIEIRQKEKGSGPSKGPIDDEAAERGSFALLMFAIVALIAGTILPYTSLSNSSDQKSIYLPEEEGERVFDDDEEGQSKPRRQSWRLTLRTIWLLSLFLYSLQAAVLTFIARNTTQAIILLASMGIPWAVASWVPFALVMESVKEAEDGVSPYEFEADWFAPERVRERRESSSAIARARIEGSVVDCEPLPNGRDRQKPRKPSAFLARGTEIVADDTESPSRQASTGVPMPRNNYEDHERSGESLGGTVLGIHNLAIVLPQLIVALLAAIILKTGPVSPGQGSSEGVSVVWVIRIGGVAAFIAAILTRFVPLTRTERQMRGEAVMEAEPRYDDEVADGEEDAVEA